MIETIQGDVLSPETGIIVHGCNCVGVMGAGVALAVKLKYPNAYLAYMDHFYKGGKLGEISYIEVAPFKIIVNALTQNKLGRNNEQYVSYPAIESCFNHVLDLANIIEQKHNKILDICFPLIGCGLGGGEWARVSEIIDRVIPDHFNKKLYIQ